MEKEDYYKTADVFNYDLLKQNARSMRKKPTDAEKFLWEHIRGNQLDVHFRRQHPIGIYIADFICLDKRLVIEADGGYHQLQNQMEWDQLRTNYLESQGYCVLRFTNEEILQNIDSCLQIIKNHL
ncbi:MAG: endonuclease domain-containing protein [Prevotella sp.]|nr:endonuclease domain-containing protein [Prevotella sp.]